MLKIDINETDRRVYEKELKDFLPDAFIDDHVHVWKDSFQNQGKANGGATWTHFVADEMTSENMFEIFDKMFPGKKVTPLVLGGCRKVVSECNRYVKEEKVKYGFPTLLRTEYSMTGDELEFLVKDGGFLGLKPYLTNCPEYIPASELRIYDFLPKEHLEAANKNGWIVMLHIPRSKRLRDEVNVAQLMEIEANYPDLKLIVAHIGRAYSKQDIGDAFEILKNTKNMKFDFTANVCDDAIKACIEAVGTKRLMFGSDLPIALMRMYRTTDPETGFYTNVVPRGLYGDVSYDPHMKESDETDITLMLYEQLKAFKRVAAELKLTDKQVEEIMYTNAKELIFG